MTALKSLLLLTFLLLLSACGTTPAAQLGMTNSPTTLPTRSPKPSRTLTPTWTPSLTLNATQAFITTATVAENTFLYRCGNQPSIISPDGDWCFYEIYNDSDHGLEIRVFGSSGQEWSFSYWEYFRSNFSGTTHIEYWTEDGRFLYFAPRPIVEWVGTAWSTALTLLRMDTTDGSVTQVLQGNMDDIDYFYSLSISPTGRRLIYANNSYNPLIVKILDLKTGEEDYILFEDCYRNAADFSWSEDGLQVSFLLDNHDTCEHHSYSIDIKDLSSNPNTTPTAIP